MAGSSFFALLEDIATLMDDVATLTKVATEKTAGPGDDLALNAQQVTGVTPDRELPVVWAVAKGSAVNKAILVPAALALSAVAPWAILPVLVLGGLFLCFEGSRRSPPVLHGREAAKATTPSWCRRWPIPPWTWWPTSGRRSAAPSAPTSSSRRDRGHQPRHRRRRSRSGPVVVLSVIALVMTAGVYGLVAAIVKLETGPRLSARRRARAWGRFISGWRRT
ncbi:MAG: DUF808 family protein [bacterium]